VQWVTRSDVRVGRIACSWLIKRFIDPQAEIRYLSGDAVREALDEGATPFHVPGGEYMHREGKTPFELLLEKEGPAGDLALDLLARIVNGADTDNSLYNQPEGPGVRAVTEGYRALSPGNDEEVLRRGFELFDGLYAYCQGKTGQTSKSQPS
jgi:hypothetical protein